MTLTSYLVFSAILILAGLLFTFEGGAVLTMLGLTLVLLAPLRGRRALYWPALSAIALFLIAFVLTVPLSCSGPVGPTPGSGAAWTCRSIIGITQAGPSAPLAPSVTIGAIVGVGGFFLIRLALRSLSGKVPRSASTGI